ncbi:MAG: acyl carrier protein [Deltaproteobacteria bacterium]|nr:acyl carrier protein [Deltaproteobacteria bacterium]
MNDVDVRAALLEILGRIAPETRGTAVPDAADLRDVLGLDSMDFLKFVVGIHDRLGVDVPEADYLRVSTLAGARDYVSARRPS